MAEKMTSKPVTTIKPGTTRPTYKQSAKGMQRRNPGAFDKKGQLKVGAAIKYAHGTKTYTVKKGDTADNVASRIRSGTENTKFGGGGMIGKGPKRGGDPSKGQPPAFKPQPRQIKIGTNPGGPRMGGPRPVTSPRTNTHPIDENVKSPNFGKPIDGSKPRYITLDRARPAGASKKAKR